MIPITNKTSPDTLQFDAGIRFFYNPKDPSLPSGQLTNSLNGYKARTFQNF